MLIFKRMQLLATSVFFILIGFSKAYAGCSSIDLRPELGPARDQGISMWCYAHSGADLITQKLKQRVSAFDLAATYLLADEKKLLKHNHPHIQKALKEDSDFFRRLKRWRLDEPEIYYAKNILTEKGLYYLGGLEQDAILLSAVNEGFCPDSQLPGSEPLYEQYLEEISKFADERCKSENHLLCKNPAPKKLAEVRGKKSKALADVFKQWVQSKCQTRIKPEKPPIAKSFDVAEDLSEYYQKLKSKKLFRTDVTKKMFAEVDKHLEQGRAVSIGYDLLDIWPPEDESPTLDHSSVVAARKSINGVCHYFVRTHMGPACNYLEKVNDNCEAVEGGVWLKPTDISSIYSVIHIKPD